MSPRNATADAGDNVNTWAGTDHRLFVGNLHMPVRARTRALPLTLVLLAVALAVWAVLQPDTRTPQQIYDACMTWGPGDHQVCTSLAR